MPTTRVAVACQGGGTHAAFTWGVLTEILGATTRSSSPASTPEKGDDSGFDIVSLSGTSAGALCALAAWYGLVPNLKDPTCGTPEKAIDRLDALWTSFAARTAVEKAHDAFTAQVLKAAENGVPMLRTGPYAPWGDLGLKALSAMGARPEYLGFGGLLPSVCPDFDAVDWNGVAAADVRMVAGAVELVSGNFEIFDSDKTLHDLGLATTSTGDDQYNATRWRMRRPLSLEGVAASGTLPEVLRAQPIDDLAFPTGVPGELERRTGRYWDGLYSQNPPVRDLLDVSSPDRIPDEIWVVRINPQEQLEPHDKMALDDIRDRENALAGNLSLNGELDHIETINKWLRAYGDEHPPLAGRKLVTVRTIKMGKETASRLSHTSKFHRDMAHLESLRDEGRAVTTDWLAGWMADGDAFPHYPDDARYVDA
ncbi:MAG TPA: patatin-like phospholipase family protein [Acidimicrobiales bacterium]